MLRSNVRRRTALDIPSFLSDDFPAIDTLTISRLLRPGYASHTLEAMIRELGVAGINSHNAIDDVAATAALSEKMYEIAQPLLPGIMDLRRDVELRKTARRFTNAYGAFYHKWQTMMLNCEQTPENTLVGAIVDANAFFSGNKYTEPIEHLDYALDLIDACMVTEQENTFNMQLGKHLFDLLTFNESDFYVNEIVKEKITISTVHKAKGLEMDNVVVFNASAYFGSPQEHARLLYVAFSRAKKRLAVGIAGSIPKVLEGLTDHFKIRSPEETATALRLETIHMMQNRKRT